MRLRGKDMAAGTLRLEVDNLDDLWTLRNLIQPGDLVDATSLRSAEAATDKLRAEKQPKRPMRLGVRVEQVEWHDFADHLRVLGTIETGPQDLGRHHTHVFGDVPGTRLTIHKPGGLKPWHLRAVDEAVAAAKRPRVVLLAIDDSEAQFATLTSYGVQFQGTIAGSGQGKRFADRGGAAGAAKRGYYDEVLRALVAQRTDPATPLLVVGPGWWREEFLEHVRQKAPDQVGGALTDGTAQAGRTGIHEALRRGMLEKVARDHRVAEDTALVEEVLARIAKDGAVAYGPADVAHAVQVGAAEVVLVTDDLVRAGRHDGLLHDAEGARARIRVIATGHDAGVQLQRFGGLAALLRFVPG